MATTDQALSQGPGNRLEDGIDFANQAEVLGQLAKINRGIEKEGLRCDAQHLLSQTPHPAALGSALANSWITTDFSESLLEFITPVSTARGESASIPCAASPPIAFCQDQVATSNLSQGRAIANAADVASQMAKL